MANQILWPDIDHAEKCLVSAMYEEAAEVAKSTLRILVRDAGNEVNRSPSAQNEALRQNDECEEEDSMIEAAGMVLLQALNQMERPCNIFSDLISIFDGVAKVPYCLILTGTCLQLSMGLHPSSQTAIEEYLSGWRLPEGSSYGLMVKVVQSHVSQKLNDTSSIEVNDSNGAACTVYLSRTNYLQLTEIYAIEVLGKLQKTSVAARVWIQNSNISEEDKQVALQRLQLVSQSQKSVSSSSTSQRSEKSPKVSQPVERTREETADAGSLEQELSTSLESQPIGVQLPPTASEESKSRVMKGSGIWRFPFLRMVLRLVELVMIRVSITSTSTWMATQRKLPRSKLLLTGVFSPIIVYAILRKRQLLLRSSGATVGWARKKQVRFLLGQLSAAMAYMSIFGYQGRSQTRKDVCKKRNSSQSIVTMKSPPALRN